MKSEELAGRGGEEGIVGRMVKRILVESAVRTRSFGISESCLDLDIVLNLIPDIHIHAVTIVPTIGGIERILAKNVEPLVCRTFNGDPVVNKVLAG